MIDISQEERNILAGWLRTFSKAMGEDDVEATLEGVPLGVTGRQLADEIEQGTALGQRMALALNNGRVPPGDVERLMEDRRERFFALVKKLTPWQVDEKGTLLELAMARMIGSLPEKDVLSVVDKQFHAARALEPDSPASMTCHGFNEAHFSILGNYIQGLPHHIKPAKCACSGDYTEVTGTKGLHRFNVSAHSGKIFDVSLDQYRVAKEMPLYDTDRVYVAYGKNGYPTEYARRAIHFLKDIFDNAASGRACLGAMYEGYKAELYDLTSAAAEYWPLKEERDRLGIDFYNRTQRQAAAHLEETASHRAEKKARRMEI